MKILLSLLIWSISSGLFATSFNNNLHSDLIVSPAQYHQVKRLRIDTHADTAAQTFRSDTQTNNRRIDASSNDLRISVATSIFEQVKMGIGLRQVAVDYRQQQTGFALLSPEMHGRNTFNEISYVVAVPLADSIYIAGKYGEISGELPDNGRSERSYVQPGIAFSGSRAEFGVSYIPQTTETIIANSAEVDERLRKFPSKWILHGRYAAGMKTYVGAQVIHKIIRVVDDGERQFGSDQNSTEASFSVERRINRLLKLDSIVSYATSGNDVDSSGYLFNVPGVGFSSNLDYKVGRGVLLNISGRYAKSSQAVDSDSDDSATDKNAISTNRYSMGVGAQVSF